MDKQKHELLLKAQKLFVLSKRQIKSPLQPLSKIYSPIDTSEKCRSVIGHKRGEELNENLKLNA